MYNNTIPTGSPLSPYSPPAPLRPIGMQMEAPQLAPAPQAFEGGSAIAELPSPPPSKRAKNPSIWDKQHISETLANIGAGFFGSQNFGDGLGAAAQTIAKGTHQLREDQKKSISYGGPGDQFEIATDGQGNRTVREVPEFAAAAARAAKAKNAPSATDAVDLRARAVYAITQLPPEQRAAAYADLVQHPDQYGVDATGMPPAWSEQYGTMGGMMGLKVDQSLSQERANVVAKDQMRHRGVVEQQGAARVSQGEARVQQGAARLAKAPPSTRGGGGGSKPSKGYSIITTKSQFNALPSGSKFKAPDGSLRIKP